MAEIGLGYGSEFQLMRFLGHHRDELNQQIQQKTKIEGSIEWLDFPYDDERISGDGEWKGITCFKGLENYPMIENKWKNFWPQSGTAMNWDGVFKTENTWYFVEAKAHKDESFQKCSATSDVSIMKIREAFNKTQQWLADKGINVKKEINWIETDCYQLANRLAFLCFCDQCGIKARLIYIGFVNGFRRKKDEIQSDDEWMKIWKEEMDELGLNYEEMNPYISFVHPNCEPEKKKT